MQCARHIGKAEDIVFFPLNDGHALDGENEDEEEANSGHLSKAQLLASADI